jgi:hypothetical protein
MLRDLTATNNCACLHRRRFCAQASILSLIQMDRVPPYAVCWVGWDSISAPNGTALLPWAVSSWQNCLSGFPRNVTVCRQVFSVSVFSCICQREREREHACVAGRCVNLVTSVWLSSETKQNWISPATRQRNEDFLCSPREPGFDPTANNMGFVVVKVAIVVARC